MTLALDRAIAFFHEFLEKERAACTAWHLGEKQPIEQAKAMLHRPERGLPIKRYVRPQPWCGGTFRVTKEEIKRERAALAKLPYSTRKLFAVERRDMKGHGIIAFAYVGAQRQSTGGTYIANRFAAATFDGQPLICHMALASSKGTWLFPQGLDLKGSGKFVDGRRLVEPQANDPLLPMWKKLPA